MAGKVSRADIAKNLGLSLATVKRALGNYVGVDMDTKQRVLCEAERLGYKFSVLKADVAVIMPCVPSYFWSELRNYLELFTKKERLCSRFFFFHDIGNESDALCCLERAIESRATVFICALPDTQSLREKIEQIKEKIKIIFIEEFNFMNVEGCYYIGEDPYEEGYTLAKRYLSMYNDRKRFLVYGSKTSQKETRLDGFLAALREQGMTAVQSEVPISINTKTRAAIWAREIKKHMQETDCIFYASGMVNLLADALAKLDGGADIHIIGFDNDERASFDNVMLASLQNLQKQAETAARTAGNYIRDGSFPTERCFFVKDKIIQKNRAQSES
ncbi:MAG: LacI family transcriptional regulator [Ruminococcaceae bacterium]|nr:LacI family transcriptional regulator [Oscillospiraceae bacterium]